MGTQIRQLDPACASDRQAWQSFVGESPSATLFHSIQWMDAVRSAFRHRPRYLMACRDHQVVGVLPLFEIHSFLAGTLLVSVPYAVYGGVLCDDANVSHELLQETQRLAGALRASYVDIRSRETRFPDLLSVDRYVTFIKTLPDQVGEVLGSYPRKARAEVRKARDKFRLRVQFDDQQLPLVWKLYSRSMRRLGSPNLPHKFFESLIHHLPEGHLVSVIYDADKPLAGLVSFFHKDTILPYYSGCDERDANTHSANNYLYFTLMEKAVELGLHQFDFGRTRIDNSGSYQFKKNQGFEPTPLGYQYFVPKGGPAPNLTPSNKKFKLASRIWQKLPLAFTRPMGSWLSSSIPG